MRRILWIALGIVGLFAVAQGGTSPWNNPHQGSLNQNVRYTPIIGSPKSLDPARAYSTDEHEIIGQIYEPPLQYHYLKRPYQLVPLTATMMPKVTYYDAEWHRLADNVNPKQIVFSVYDIFIQPGIRYQPHPALAKDKEGNYLYFHLTKKEVRKIRSVMNFPEMGTRELIADDYVYEIKRLASPNVLSPIFGVMSKHILGFAEYGDFLQKTLAKKSSDEFFDLRQYPLESVKIIDRYHYQIRIKGIYQQFSYWLAMAFFSPIPWEADEFYSQPILKTKNITLNTYPIGTGPYLLAENNPNKQIILVKNPNFHLERYPTEGEADDTQKGYLEDAGKQLPFIDKIVFVLDKEGIPRWNKFLQGYYDKSGIGAESFDQAIKMDSNGAPQLTPEMQERGIKLNTTVIPGIFYIGFNMEDPIVGGYSPQKQKLRQAIGIALDYEEYIAIFLNGRGIPAQGPIPPGIFGYVSGEQGINPYVYEWFHGKPKRRSLAEAKKLLAEAGYPGGIDPKTKKPLVLNYDVATTGNPDDKAQFDWLREQFGGLGIELNIRATLYNRFQDEVRKGKTQIFSWGWLADYPDPEDFLFLLYTLNGKAKYGGENTTNYSNPAVDRLFEEISLLPNGPLRQEKINELLESVRKDSPWVWGFHPISFTLSHQWNRVSKPHGIANNVFKYERLNPELREQSRKNWNQPLFWPLFILIGLIVILFIPLVVNYWRRERRPTIRKMK